MLRKIISFLVVVNFYFPLANAKSYQPSEVIELEESFLDTLTAEQVKYLEGQLSGNSDDDFEFIDMDDVEQTAASQMSHTMTSDPELRAPVLIEVD